MIARCILFLSLFLFSNIGSGQDSRLYSINLCVDYVNKSIDGGFIVQRLLENYNKDVNKYVDLDTFKLNFYTNKDLPKDLFASTWFYDPTPATLYSTIKNDKLYQTNEEVRNIIDNIQEINNDLNTLRYNIEEDINSLDLSKKENLGIIYNSLERGVERYEAFYKSLLRLKQVIESEFNSYNIAQEFPEFRKKINRLYEANFELMRSIRSKDDNRINNALIEQVAAYEEIKDVRLSDLNSLRYKEEKVKKHFNQLLTKSQEISNIGRAAITGDGVPKEVKPYGKYYYNYNYSGLSKCNEQGPGMISDLNHINKLTDADQPIKFELPYYFKVIYPKRIEKIDLAQAANSILELPKIIEDREVRIADYKIRTSHATLVVEIYDHLIEDGDIVSLQFNDQWILKNHPLTKYKYKIELKLNKKGKNYLLLHAENEGRRPPNTMAVDYDYYGNKKRFILESDMNTSELIEIIYTN